MRTNLFNFKEKEKDKIVLEEEKIENPFLLFLKKYQKYILLLLLLLAIIFLIIGVYYLIKDLDSSTKIITNIDDSLVVEFDDSNTINSSNLKPTTGGNANRQFYSRYGNIGLTEGVIFVVKVIDTPNGKITYYSDGSAKFVRNDGTIVRIAALDNGNYGINENGIIIVGAKTKEISITNTTNLSDGNTIIYYSDGSAEVITASDNITMLVRNSDNIVIKNNELITINPSGVSAEKDTKEINGIKYTYYSDGTIKVEKGNEVYIVRNSEDIDTSNGNFLNNNEATIIKTITLNDGDKIIYFSDGSAIIEKDGETVSVRQSKDIIYDDDRVIEIIKTKYANASSTKNTPDNKEIVYLDNGAGLIKNADGTYEYVYENSDIKYDDNDNIKSIDGDSAREITHKTTPDGTIVIDLDDGTSIIIDSNGYLIVDTDKIIYDTDGNIVKILDEEDNDEDDSISDSHFTIKNTGEETIKYMIVLEETKNYNNQIRLDPIYLKYNLVINSTYLNNQIFDNKLKIGTTLKDGSKITNNTYILYEGELEPGKEADVNLGIWLDYTDITNDYMDSVFIGTIKVLSNITQ